jgi:4-diphosphocytidyl-2C-methyl-D-erythritol kinase
MREEVMRIQANAKLNLFLNITEQLPTGYHNLEMITVPLTLFDTINIEEAEVDSIIYDREVDNDVLYKTVQLIKSTFKIKKSVKIKVSKQIPISGGLGGGSADIAAVLRGLVQFWNIKTDDDKLMELGKSLGSDVPICLFNKPAKVSGTGDQIIPLPGFKAHVLLVIPSNGISTKSAFKLVQDYELKRVDSTRLLIGIMKHDVDEVAKHLHNDFIPIASILDASTRQALRTFKELNPNASMTGSGSTLFAIYSDEGKLRKDQELLNKQGLHTQYCQILTS